MQINSGNKIAMLQIRNRMNKNAVSYEKNLSRLASGQKFSGAGEDASAYSISEKMKVQIRSLKQNIQNTQNGSALLRTAEGATSSTVDILRTMKEKAIAAANDTCTTEDHYIIQRELDQAIDQIGDNANVTFNGKALLNGSLDKSHKALRATYYHDMFFEFDPTDAPWWKNYRDQNGNKLDIAYNDTIRVSAVVNGKNYTAEHTAVSIAADGTITLNHPGVLFADLNNQLWDERLSESFQTMISANFVDYIGYDDFGEKISTPDGKKVFLIETNRLADGAVDDVYCGLSGFSMEVVDADGNVKRSVTDFFNSFKIGNREKAYSGDNALTFQTGTRSNQVVRVGLSDLTPESLGLRGTSPKTKYTYGGIDFQDNGQPAKNLQITTKDYASAAIAVLDNALNIALEEQTKLGAVRSRLEYTEENLTVSAENTTTADSAIADANMAKEMLDFTKNSILLQASQAMFSHSGRQATETLSLLK